KLRRLASQEVGRQPMARGYRILAGPRKNPIATTDRPSSNPCSCKLISEVATADGRSVGPPAGFIHPESGPHPKELNARKFHSSTSSFGISFRNRDGGC